jgi:hypothetical protein
MTRWHPLGQALRHMKLYVTGRPTRHEALRDMTHHIKSFFRAAVSDLHARNWLDPRRNAPNSRDHLHLS